MIKVNIVTVGNVKDDFYVKAINEYVKRIGAYAKINVVEVKESRLPKNYSNKDILKVKQAEAVLLKEKAKGYLIALEVKGKKLTSEAFANTFKTVANNGQNEISFIIGGSYGLDENFSKSCNLKLSFSDFTFPHQLMRVILCEQIYRAFTILNNKTYHK